MTQERELLKLALKALRKARRKVLTTEECHSVIMSIKEPLAQPEQEPVAWVSDREARMVWWNDKFTDIKQAPPNNTPLYTTPPQRKPLTDEQISELWDGHVVPVFGKNGINPIVFARAIEAAHNIKE